MSAPFDFTLLDPTVVSKDEQISVTNAAVGFTATNLPGVVGALCLVETAPIRFTEDGIVADAPTTTFGTLANPGDHIIVWGGSNMTNFRAIRTTGTSATLDVQYLKTK